MMTSFLCQLPLAAYYTASLPYRHWQNRRLSATGRAPICVLFYHRIADDRASPWTHSNALFEQQIRWLQARYEIISLAEAQSRLRRGQNTEPAVCITFDDGYAENCDRALPLLIAEKIPCTYFVSTGNVLNQQPFPHDVAGGYAGKPNTLAQLRWMAENGIEIGAHTRTHADVGKIADEVQLYDEVVVAGEELQNAVGRAVHYFAFPYGQPRNMTQRAVQMACEYGYDGFCSAYGAYNFAGNDPYHLRRIHADDMLRLKNWCTVDPRKCRVDNRFEYHLESTNTTPCLPADAASA